MSQNKNIQWCVFRGGCLSHLKRHAQRLRCSLRSQTPASESLCHPLCGSLVPGESGAGGGVEDECRRYALAEEGVGSDKEKVGDWAGVKLAQGRGLKSLHYPARCIDRQGRRERHEGGGREHGEELGDGHRDAEARWEARWRFFTKVVTNDLFRDEGPRTRWSDVVNGLSSTVLASGFCHTACKWFYSN